MHVLRDNKESLMAMLEAFVHDPLINWRLLDLTTTGKDRINGDDDVETINLCYRNHQQKQTNESTNNPNRDQ
jgi:phosphatidylinositol kinase/protein kinase (PI-3  family)